MTHPNKHLFIYEPRTEGHHLHWLGLLSEDLLNAGYDLTLGVNIYDSIVYQHLNSYNPNILKQARTISTHTDEGKLRTKNKLKTAEYCFQASGADELFCNSLDEFSSQLFRYQALGFGPSKNLFGKVSGIFHRPRVLEKSFKGFNFWLKRIGFKQLVNKDFFKHCFLLDEFLIDQVNVTNPFLHFIPDPWEVRYPISKEDAKKTLEIPQNRLVLLHYGLGSRRKGLHLLLEALKSSKLADKFYLIVAGKHNLQGKDLQRLNELENDRIAMSLNYFISLQEEQMCYAASDYVMIPYISHYGGSHVLSQATGAQRPVLASDHHLIGERVIKHNLGTTFKNNDPLSLKIQLESLLKIDPNQFTEDLITYSQLCSRDSFRKALYQVYPKLT